MAATFFKEFPDMAFEVRSVIEQGNVVVLEAATKGTFTGPMARSRLHQYPNQHASDRPIRGLDASADLRKRAAAERS